MDIKTLLGRGVEEVIDKKHLETALRSGKKLRVKLGIDPTSPNIHIGRAVLLWKLRAFQDASHTAVFIVGDLTGLVGDASDKDAERPMLTQEEIRANMRTYFAQAYKILDKKKTEVYYNSKWLKKMGFVDVAKMASLFGLHEFEARDVIARRMKAGKRVSFHELIYPLMQGYDSVMVRADVELGGTDQRFNLLTGRRIQELYGQKPQDIVMMDILEGTDGRKMSSSWGNVINITDSADEMFGKVMSIQDTFIKKYFLLATSLPMEKIEKVLRSMPNPRDQKLFLAESVVWQYYDQKIALTARKNFEKKFGKLASRGGGGEIRADLELKKKPGNYNIVDLLVEGHLAASKSEARRKIIEGAVEVDGSKIKDERAPVKLTKNSLIRLGKRFLRIT
ncbi:MAG: tyrosine--tRNA ligase [Candidatus Doudnabacteria bacterium]|nr:tyrosine--tRNA ligase [bacterium]MDZ4243831.1 tyrosine--tRNA ligase [Candidatus Doudnabacteria bacterium]